MPKNRNILFLIIPLLTGYLSALFITTHEKHCHILPDREVVYHVHPFQKDKNKPSGNHTHHPGETIDFQCNLFDFQENTPLSENKNYACGIETVSYDYISPFPVRITLITISLRAPPVA